MVEVGGGGGQPGKACDGRSLLMHMCLRLACILFCMSAVLTEQPISVEASAGTRLRLELVPDLVMMHRHIALLSGSARASRFRLKPEHSRAV